MKRINKTIQIKGVGNFPVSLLVIEPSVNNVDDIEPCRIKSGLVKGELVDTHNRRALTPGHLHSVLFDADGELIPITARARRHPDDAWNERTGVELVLLRLRAKILKRILTRGLALTRLATRNA